MQTAANIISNIASEFAMPYLRGSNGGECGRECKRTVLSETPNFQSTILRAHKDLGDSKAQVSNSL